MGNNLWKPMVEYPGYEINRKAWVRNLRGYVVASGRGVTLLVSGVRVGIKQARLLELAAEAFGNVIRHIPKTDFVDAPAGPVDETPLEIMNKVTPIAAAHKSYAHPHSTRERMRQWIDPEHKLPMRDPWADGTIEADSCWDLAVL